MAHQLFSVICAIKSYLQILPELETVNFPTLQTPFFWIFLFPFICVFRLVKSFLRLLIYLPTSVNTSQHTLTVYYFNSLPINPLAEQTYGLPPNMADLCAVSTLHELTYFQPSISVSLKSVTKCLPLLCILDFYGSHRPLMNKLKEVCCFKKNLFHCPI